MSDHRESYEPVDRFSEHFRQRLKMYPVAPDENCWDEIEARLQQRKKRGFPSLRLGLLVAASLLTVVFVINHLLTKEKWGAEEHSAYQKENPAERLVTEKENPAETAFVADPTDAVAMNKQTVPDSRIPATRQTAGKQRPDAVSEAATKPDADDEAGVKPDLVSEVGAKSDAVGEADAKPDAVSEAATKSDALSEVSVNQDLISKVDAKSDVTGEVGTKPDAADRGEIAGRETPSPTNRQQPERKEENTPDEATTTGPEPPGRRFANQTAYRMPDINKRNKRPDWQLSAGFSPVGGLSSFGSFLNARDNQYYVSAPDGEGGNYTGASPKEQIVDVQPSIPFSTGITVRRKWNQTLGIETGIVYTRLSSDLVVDREGFHYDAVLILHYVGVPVNLTINLWEKNRFGLYASGGGMVEKGIRSVFKQKTPWFPDRMMNDQVNRISGLQWSLQGGIGISYRLYREMSLYLEPGVSYYFDGKQPVSKRTEDPLNFNLRLGVRYDF